RRAAKTGSGDNRKSDSPQFGHGLQLSVWRADPHLANAHQERVCRQVQTGGIGHFSQPVQNKPVARVQREINSGPTWWPSRLDPAVTLFRVSESRVSVSGVGAPPSAFLALL